MQRLKTKLIYAQQISIMCYISTNFKPLLFKKIIMDLSKSKLAFIVIKRFFSFYPPNAFLFENLSK